MNPSSWFGAGADSRLQVLWDDGERVFCRRSREAGDGDAMLAVVPASDPPTPRSLDRLAHEYGLKDELDGAWAVRPLSLLREHGQTVLVTQIGVTRSLAIHPSEWLTTIKRLIGM